MKSIEEKIKSKHYAKPWIATAVVKRADISPQARNKLLALVEKTYGPSVDTKPDVTIVQPPGIAVKLPTGNTYSVLPPTPFRTPQIVEKLDQQLLQIAFQLLGLCIEHKLSREEVYSRLEARLMAGMG